MAFASRLLRLPEEHLSIRASCPTVNQVDPQQKKRSPFSPVGRIVSWGLIGIAAFVLSLFCYRPDRLAAMTVIPTECWFLGGVALQLMFVKICQKSLWRISMMIWLAFSLLWVEPPVSLWRMSVPAPLPSSERHRIRIVSLNCEVGSPAALRDLIAQRPDLVLLQESPNRETLSTWVQELFGDQGAMIWSPDASILARGKLTPRQFPAESAFVAATWELEGQPVIDVFSLRLWPQPFRVDYWNPACWQRFYEVRKIQREQVQTLQLVAARYEHPLIVGGDFNCVPGDPAEAPLREVGLKDAYFIAGRGWGRTITNDYPFHRIDRLWLSSNLTPINVVALRTCGSDHRLLNCDVDLDDSQGRGPQSYSAGNGKTFSRMRLN